MRITTTRLRYVRNVVGFWSIKKVVTFAAIAVIQNVNEILGRRPLGAALTLIKIDSPHTLNSFQIFEILKVCSKILNLSYLQMILATSLIIAGQSVNAPPSSGEGGGRGEWGKD